MKSRRIETSRQHAIVPRGAVLVIGFGNTLRSDDAVGPRASGAVASWDLPGVIAKAVPQLTPELAEPLAAARLAIFVDARLAAEREQVEVQPIEPSTLSLGAALGHVANPRSLLALAQMAYGTCPRSWLITVPATDFSLGEGLSTTAERGLEEALRQIAARLGRFGSPPPGLGGTEHAGSNPVVGDDGKLMAFRMAKSSDPAGVGHGSFVKFGPTSPGAHTTRS